MCVDFKTVQLFIAFLKGGFVKRLIILRKKLLLVCKWMFLCFRLFEKRQEREPSGARFRAESNNVIVLLSSSEKLDLIFRSLSRYGRLSPVTKGKRQQQRAAGDKMKQWLTVSIPVHSSHI